MAITEQEGIDFVLFLYNAEREGVGRKAEIILGPYTAFVTIGAIQLAQTHPSLNPRIRELLQQVIDQIAGPLFDGTPGEELIKLGSDRVFHIPGGCRHPFGPHAPECPPGGHLGFADPR